MSLLVYCCRFLALGAADLDMEEDPFADVDVSSAVEHLLSMPFEAAMKSSKELRNYAT